MVEYEFADGRETASKAVEHAVLGREPQPIERRRGDEGDDGRQEQRELAAERPDRAQEQPDSRSRAGAGVIVEQVAEGLRHVLSGIAEAAKPRVDRAAIGANHRVDPRAGRIVDQRFGEPRPFGGKFLTLRALAVEPARQFLLVFGRRGRGAARIAAAVHGLISERGIIGAVAARLERDIDGGGERARRIEVAPAKPRRIERRHYEVARPGDAGPGIAQSEIGDGFAEPARAQSSCPSRRDR